MSERKSWDEYFIEIARVVTAFPCHLCAKLLANAGVARVVFAEDYRVDLLAVEALSLARVEVISIDVLRVIASVR